MRYFFFWGGVESVLSCNSDDFVLCFHYLIAYCKWIQSFYLYLILVGVQSKIILQVIIILLEMQTNTSTHLNPCIAHLRSLER